MTDVAAAPPPRRSRAARIGWALFYVLIDGPAVAVVVVGLLAAYVAWRPFWWMQLVAIGLPYAIWPVAGLGLVCLLWRQWRAAALHALLVAFVLLRVGVPGRFETPAPGPEDLQLTTFNVPQIGPSGEELADSVAAFVAEAEPDVLLLQDASVVQRGALGLALVQPVQVQAVRERLQYQLPLPPDRTDDAQRVEVPILIRPGADVEVLGMELIQTGGSGNVDGSHALRARIRWDGREVVVYNIHLRSFGADKPWDDPAVGLLRPKTWAPYLRRYRGVYAERGVEAAELADQIAAETLPVIVAGDFNSTADNRSYHLLRTAGRRRTDAMQAVGGTRWGRTYHAERPFVRIDFVLVDPAFEVTSATTTPVTFSDHRPVRVGLRWRDGGGGEE